MKEVGGVRFLCYKTGNERDRVGLDFAAEKYGTEDGRLQGWTR